VQSVHSGPLVHRRGGGAWSVVRAGSWPWRCWWR
jgi:hypothetical protein